MPQGKGTYGSKVGRPPKKKKYYGGGSVDPFSSKNPEGVIAKKEMEAIEEMNTQGNIQDAIPTTNAMDRSQTSPDTEQYGLGGGIAQSKKQKEEQKLSREKARKRIAKEKMEYGKPKKKKKWEGRA